MNSPKVYNVVAKLAPFYDFMSGLIGYRRAVASFVKRIPFATDQSIKVLDAGGGTGPYTLSMLEHFPKAEIYAFDINPGLIERLSQRLNGDSRAHVFVADLNGSLSEVPGHDFDLIITAGVLEYLPIAPTVSKLAAFLRPGGYFANSPLKNNALGKLVGYLYGCNPYTVEANLEAFTRLGFSLKERYVPDIFNFKEFLVFQKSAQTATNH